MLNLQMEISKLTLKGKHCTVSIIHKVQVHHRVRDQNRISSLSCHGSRQLCKWLRWASPAPIWILVLGQLTPLLDGSSSRSLPDWCLPQFWVWRQNYSRLSQLLGSPPSESRGSAFIDSANYELKMPRKKRTCAEHVQSYLWFPKHLHCIK